MSRYRPPSNESFLESWQVDAIFAGIAAWLVYFVLALARGTPKKEIWTPIVLFALISGMWLFIVQMFAFGLMIIGDVGKGFGLDMRAAASFVMSDPFYFGSLILVNLGLVGYQLREDATAKLELQGSPETAPVLIDSQNEGNGHTLQAAETTEELGELLRVGVTERAAEAATNSLRDVLKGTDRVFLARTDQLSVSNSSMDQGVIDRILNDVECDSIAHGGKVFVFVDRVKLYQKDVDMAMKRGTTPQGEASRRVIKRYLPKKSIWLTWPYRKYQ
jgi:hypothetical protein